MSKQIIVMVKTLEEYMANPPQKLMTEPEEGEYRFTHLALKKMVGEYWGGIPELQFFYLPIEGARTPNQSTKDRTSNTPGEKAPKRETIDILIGKHEKSGMSSAGRIKDKLLKRLRDAIWQDEINCQKTTSAGKDDASSLAELMETLRKQLEEERRV
jgi:hypothetical protein